uniref:Uncharacterized protein n=1 Tax=Chromera velia CCMP2878 TaxID=1169474 RepID=A0A0G4F0F9_9ALVE|eukprot:Cvel_14465.t1-p1 / transcript=Cvel_14465.t1 / gene=Cvel_14465 / organism=Chromera_velia_CCMP2878 / gene_product=SCO-spondin, putative / transcript_product=SCO-spondin, putative / location=Cvel_scaffold1030:14820-43262(+) / protein_length=3023 / sequence_SO=supercontig / SO=protein_coding / is_pseudo=false
MRFLSSRLPLVLAVWWSCSLCALGRHLGETTALRAIPSFEGCPAILPGSASFSNTHASTLSRRGEKREHSLVSREDTRGGDTETGTTSASAMKTCSSGQFTVERFRNSLPPVITCCNEDSVRCAGCSEANSSGNCATNRCKPGFEPLCAPFTSNCATKTCTACEDLPYEDADGNSCSVLCTDDKVYNATETANFKEKGRGGLTAMDACCKCGGGVRTPTPFAYEKKATTLGRPVSMKPYPRTARRYLFSDCDALLEHGLHANAETGEISGTPTASEAFKASCVVTAVQDEARGLMYNTTATVDVAPFSYGSRFLAVGAHGNIKVKSGYTLQGTTKAESGGLASPPGFSIPAMRTIAGASGVNATEGAEGTDPEIPVVKQPASQCRISAVRQVTKSGSKTEETTDSENIIAVYHSLPTSISYASLPTLPSGEKSLSVTLGHPITSGRDRVVPVWSNGDLGTNDDGTPVSPLAPIAYSLACSTNTAGVTGDTGKVVHVMHTGKLLYVKEGEQVELGRLDALTGEITGTPGSGNSTILPMTYNAFQRRAQANFTCEVVAKVLQAGLPDVHRSRWEAFNQKLKLTVSAASCWVKAEVPNKQLQLESLGTAPNDFRCMKKCEAMKACAGYYYESSSKLNEWMSGNFCPIAPDILAGPNNFVYERRGPAVGDIFFLLRNLPARENAATESLCPPATFKWIIKQANHESDFIDDSGEAFQLNGPVIGCLPEPHSREQIFRLDSPDISGPSGSYAYSLDPCECFPPHWGPSPPISADQYQKLPASGLNSIPAQTAAPQLIARGRITCLMDGLLGSYSEKEESECATRCRANSNCKRCMKESKRRKMLTSDPDVDPPVPSSSSTFFVQEGEDGTKADDSSLDRENMRKEGEQGDASSLEEKSVREEEEEEAEGGESSLPSLSELPNLAPPLQLVHGSRVLLWHQTTPGFLKISSSGSLSRKAGSYFTVEPGTEDEELWEVVDHGSGLYAFWNRKSKRWLVGLPAGPAGGHVTTNSAVLPSDQTDDWLWTARDNTGNGKFVLKNKGKDKWLSFSSSNTGVAWATTDSVNNELRSYFIAPKPHVFPFIGATVGIWNEFWKKWVGMDAETPFKVRPYNPGWNLGSSNTAEQFKVIDMGEGHVGFFNPVWKKFITCWADGKINGNGGINSGNPWSKGGGGSYERMVINGNPDGSVHFRCAKQSSRVWAMTSTDVVSSPSNTKVAVWEQFHIVVFKWPDNLVGGLWNPEHKRFLQMTTSVDVGVSESAADAVLPRTSGATRFLLHTDNTHHETAFYGLQEGHYISARSSGKIGKSPQAARGTFSFTGSANARWVVTWMCEGSVLASKLFQRVLSCDHQMSFREVKMSPSSAASPPVEMRLPFTVVPLRACFCPLSTDAPRAGGYSTHVGWTTCSRSCGLGFQVNRRTCTNPPPDFGGAVCSGLGASSTTRSCNPQPCPGSCLFEKELADCEQQALLGGKNVEECGKCEYLRVQDLRTTARPAPESFYWGQKLRVGCWEQRYALVDKNNNGAVSDFSLTCVDGKWYDEYGGEGFENFECAACVQVGQPSLGLLEAQGLDQHYFSSRLPVQMILQGTPLDGHRVSFGSGSSLSGEATTGGTSLLSADDVWLLDSAAAKGRFLLKGRGAAANKCAAYDANGDFQTSSSTCSATSSSQIWDPDLLVQAATGAVTRFAESTTASKGFYRAANGARLNTDFPTTPFATDGSAIAALTFSFQSGGPHVAVRRYSFAVSVQSGLVTSHTAQIAKSSTKWTIACADGSLMQSVSVTNLVGSPWNAIRVKKECAPIKVVPFCEVKDLSVDSAYSGQGNLGSLVGVADSVDCPADMALKNFTLKTLGSTGTVTARFACCSTGTVAVALQPLPNVYHGSSGLPPSSLSVYEDWEGLYCPVQRDFTGRLVFEQKSSWKNLDSFLPAWKTSLSFKEATASWCLNETSLCFKSTAVHPALVAETLETRELLPPTAPPTPDAFSVSLISDFEPAIPKDKGKGELLIERPEMPQKPPRPDLQELSQMNVEEKYAPYCRAAKPPKNFPLVKDMDELDPKSSRVETEELKMGSVAGLSPNSQSGTPGSGMNFEQILKCWSRESSREAQMGGVMTKMGRESDVMNLLVFPTVQMSLCAALAGAEVTAAPMGIGITIDLGQMCENVVAQSNGVFDFIQSEKARGVEAAFGAVDDCNGNEMAFSKIFCDLVCVSDAVRAGNKAIIDRLDEVYRVLQSNLLRMMQYHADYAESLLKYLADLQDYHAAALTAEIQNSQSSTLMQRLKDCRGRQEGEDAGDKQAKGGGELEEDENTISSRSLFNCFVLEMNQEERTDQEENREETKRAHQGQGAAFVPPFPFFPALSPSLSGTETGKRGAANASATFPSFLRALQSLSSDPSNSSKGPKKAGEKAKREKEESDLRAHLERLPRRDLDSLVSSLSSLSSNLQNSVDSRLKKAAVQMQKALLPLQEEDESHPRHESSSFSDREGLSRDRAARLIKTTEEFLTTSRETHKDLRSSLSSHAAVVSSLLGGRSLDNSHLDLLSAHTDPTQQQQKKKKINLLDIPPPLPGADSVRETALLLFDHVSKSHGTLTAWVTHWRDTLRRLSTDVTQTGAKVSALFASSSSFSSTIRETESAQRKTEASEEVMARKLDEIASAVRATQDQNRQSAQGDHLLELSEILSDIQDAASEYVDSAAELVETEKAAQAGISSYIQCQSQSPPHSHRIDDAFDLVMPHWKKIGVARSASHSSLLQAIKTGTRRIEDAVRLLSFTDLVPRVAELSYRQVASTLRTALNSNSNENLKSVRTGTVQCEDPSAGPPSSVNTEAQIVSRELAESPSGSLLQLFADHSALLSWLVSRVGSEGLGRSFWLQRETSMHRKKEETYMGAIVERRERKMRMKNGGKARKRGTGRDLSDGILSREQDSPLSLLQTRASKQSEKEGEESSALLHLEEEASDDETARSEEGEGHRQSFSSAAAVSFAVEEEVGKARTAMLSLLSALQTAQQTDAVTRARTEATQAAAALTLEMCNRERGKEP